MEQRSASDDGFGKSLTRLAKFIKYRRRACNRLLDGEDLEFYISGRSKPSSIRAWLSAPRSSLRLDGQPVLYQGTAFSRAEVRRGKSTALAAEISVAKALTIMDDPLRHG